MGWRLSANNARSAAPAAIQALLDLSRDGSAVLSGRDGAVLYANPAIKRMLGVDKLDCGVLRSAGCEVERWLNEKESEHRQLIWLSGEFFQVSVRRMGEEADEVLLLNLGQPEREQDAREHIRTERHSFAYQVMESMGQGLTVINSDGLFEYVNPAYARMVGYTREELIGKSPLEITLPADRSMVRQAMLRRQGGETTIYDSHIMSKDGQVIDVLVTAVPMLKQRHPFGAITVVTNLADRRRVTEDLRHSSEAMRRMYEIISSAELDFQSKLAALLSMGRELFDMRAGVLFRIAEGELEVQFSADDSGQLPPGTRFPLQNMLSREVLAANGPLAIESLEDSAWRDHVAAARFQLKSYLGARVLVAGRVYGTLVFASGEPHKEKFSASSIEFLRLMAQWIGGEIEREHYLHTLQDYASQIEQKSADLSEARDQALQASRVKSEFLAVMSHEIRTPLNAVIGMNELLLDGGLNAEQREYSRVARDSASALLMLIDDILDFSKIEAGKLVLENAVFQLDAVIRSTVQMFALTARQKGLELCVDLAPGLPDRLVGDSLRLRQVLVNLLGNAVKFTERGSICIRATAEPDGQDRVCLFCEVEDTGPGLSAEARERIFEPFTQADGSTTRRYGGTGLGLAISQQLVRMMDGKLQVESEEGRGSRFWFTARFQVAREAEPDEIWPAGQAELLPPPEVLPAAAERKLVLLAEDNPANRRLAIAQLRRLGYQVEAVSNGHQVVRAVQRQTANYALLLLDCRMPEMDGFGAARAVRQLEQATGGRIPIVAMTANSLSGDREACLAAGMDDYITKPVTLEKLQNTLERWAASPREPVVDLEPALDASVLAGLRSLGEEGEDFLGGLAAVFLADSKGQIELIARPDGQPSEALREAVHALKGSSSSLGARRLAAMCAELEQHLAQGGSLQHARELIERILKEYERAAAELRAANKLV